MYFSPCSRCRWKTVAIARACEKKEREKTFSPSQTRYNPHERTCREYDAAELRSHTTPPEHGERNNNNNNNNTRVYVVKPRSLRPIFIRLLGIRRRLRTVHAPPVGVLHARTRAASRFSRRCVLYIYFFFFCSLLSRFSLSRVRR